MEKGALLLILGALLIYLMEGPLLAAVFVFAVITDRYL